MSPSDSPPRPAWPSQASGWSFARPRDGVSRVAPALVVYVPSSLPRWNRWVPVALFPSDASFPCISARSASTSSVSRPAQRLLALQPAHSRSHLMTLSIGGFSRVVTFPTAPIATGRSDPCRKGFAPSREPCLSTAHAYIALSPGTGLSCPRRSRDKPATLTPASGCRDHTTSPSASGALVSRAISVHRSPPHVRDDRETPLVTRRGDSLYSCFYLAVKLFSEIQKYARSRPAAKLSE